MDFWFGFDWIHQAWDYLLASLGHPVILQLLTIGLMATLIVMVPASIVYFSCLESKTKNRP